MATLLEQISLKVRGLQDQRYRVLTQSHPVPNGHDFLKNLEYLSSTLTSILRDKNKSPCDDLYSKQSERERLEELPSLDYSDIFHAVMSLFDIVPLLGQGQLVLGQALLFNLNCQICFLNRDLLDCLPYSLVCVLPTWPSCLHVDIIKFIAFQFIPMTLGTSYMLRCETYSSAAITPFLSVVMQYCSSPNILTLAVEACMRFHCDVSRSLLSLISTGPSSVRALAANLLIHYYPQCKPQSIESGYIYAPWKSPECQNPNCNQVDSHRNSAYYTWNPSVGASAAELPPPFYVCAHCVHGIGIDSFTPLPVPLDHLARMCENLTCEATGLQKKAICICFSASCVAIRGINRPIRLCQSCHQSLHCYERHFVQSPLPSPYNEEDEEGQDLITEAIVSLLGEAEHCMAPGKGGGGGGALSGKKQDANADQQQLLSFQQPAEIDAETCYIYQDRRLLTRFGIWLLDSVCDCPSPDDPHQPRPEILGRLISGVFYWFQCGFVQQNDSIGTSLENLKGEVGDGWLSKVLNAHFFVFVECLMPNPPEYARIGQHWDSLESRVRQMRQGLHLIFCLMPYNVITLKVWSHVIPHWLDTVSIDLTHKELAELKFVFSKLFDQQMCAVFTVNELFHFLGGHFQSSLACEQQRALVWIQTLSRLDVTIPLSLLIGMINEGLLAIKGQAIYRANANPALSMAWLTDHHLFSADKYKVPAAVLAPSALITEPEGAEEQPETAAAADNDAVPEEDAENFLQVFIIMLDSLLKQSELQEFKAYQGLDTTYAVEIVQMLNVMLTCPMVGHHTCLEQVPPPPSSSSANDSAAGPPDVDTEEECLFCEDQSMLFELIHNLIQLLCPPTEMKLSQMYVMDEEDFRAAVAAMVTTNPTASQPSTTVRGAGNGAHVQFSHPHTPDNLNEATGVLCQLSTVDPSSGGLVRISNSVDGRPQAASASQQTAAGSACCSVSSVKVIDDCHNEVVIVNEKPAVFWETSLGCFKYDPAKFPAKLKLLFILIRSLSAYEDPGAQYNIVRCMRLMLLHADCFSGINYKQHLGFLVFIQEKHLLPTLWGLIAPHASQTVQQCVPLMFYAMCQPLGEGQFWAVLRSSFRSTDWQVRFQAVERVCAILQFVDPKQVSKIQSIQSALALCLCLCIDALNDANGGVATRANIALKSVRRSALQFGCECIEMQFDHVIADRPLLLARLETLHNLVPGIPALTWEFILRRFHTLIAESQYESFSGRPDFFPAAAASASTAAASALSDPRAERAKSVRENPPSLPLISADPAAPERLRMAGDSALGGEHRVGARFETLNHMADALLQCNIHCSILEPSIVEGGTGGGNVDKETVHMLISLLMKYMARPDMDNNSVAFDERMSGKAMNTVLRHLNNLLGYNQLDKTFSLPPHKLRTSVVLNAVMSHLAEVLDYNIQMGTQLMHMSLQLLQYLPSPQRVAGTGAAGGGISGGPTQPSPEYTLWLLEPHVRHQWLMTLLVILYKYRLDVSFQTRGLSHLIRITINTLAGQSHACQTIERPPSLVVSPTVTPSLSRHNSKDLNDLGEDQQSVNDDLLTSTRQVQPPGQSLPESDSGPEVGGAMIDNAAGLEKEPEHIVAGGPSDQAMSSGLGCARVSILVSSPSVQTGGFNSASGSSIEVDRCGDTVTPPIPQQAKASIVTSKDLRQNKSTLRQKKSHSSFRGGDNLTCLLPNEVDEGAQSDSGEIIEMISHEESESGGDTNLITLGDFPARPADTTIAGIMKPLDENGEQASSSAGPSAMRKTSGSVSPRKGSGSSTGRNSSMGFLSVQDPIGPGRGSRSSSQQLPGPVTGFSSQATSRRNSSFSINARFNEDEGAMVVSRCLECKAAIEEFDEKTISLCIVVLRTFTHRDPVAAAPFLLDVLIAISRLALQPMYTWESDSKLFVRETCSNVAVQFMRCTLHQLAPYGLFSQIFVTCVPEYVLHYMAESLQDFNGLTVLETLSLVLSNLNMRKCLPTEHLMVLLNNLSTYMSHIHWDGPAITSGLLNQFDVFFKKLHPCMPLVNDVSPLFKIACILFRLERLPGLAVPGKTQNLLGSLGALLSYILQASTFTLQQLVDLMESVKTNPLLLHMRGGTGDKVTHNAWELFIGRVICSELCNGLKFKVNLPVENLVKLVQFATMDLRNTLPVDPGSDHRAMQTQQHMGPGSSVLAVILKSASFHGLTDLFDFLGDINTVTRVKANARSMSGAGCSLHEDTLGGELKTGVAQIIATVLHKNTAAATKQFIPWLFSPPTAMQQGPKEFIDCVGYVRMLSWLLLGSLTTYRLEGGQLSGTPQQPAVLQPVPLEASSSIAEYILVLLTGFIEHSASKSSVLHLTSLFHAFICCQLWTVYLEQLGSSEMSGGGAISGDTVVLEFWGKVTPGVLQLLSHSKAHAEAVVLNFLTLLEALQECNSTVLAKLLPMWKTIFTYSSEKALQSSATQMRLQNCQNAAPPVVKREDAHRHNNLLAKWINRLQFKISQMEFQYSSISAHISTTSTTFIQV